MKLQGICGVCKRPCGLRPGDIAARHSAGRGKGWACEGTDKPADVTWWAAEERERITQRVACEDGRRVDARAECARRIAESEAREAAARLDLAALDRLMAKRAKGGAL